MPRGKVPDFSSRYIFNDRSYYAHRSIGKGGYGEVYSGFALNEYGTEYVPCAFKVQALRKKVLLGSGQFGPFVWEANERPLQELRIHQKVNGHPNIAMLCGGFELYDSECTLMVMELCRGGTLLRKIKEREGLIPPVEEVRRIFLQILDAVEHCHNKGVFHCDLKPVNILLQDGDVRLADFGIAVDTNEPLTSPRGSACYMSPEACGASSDKPYSAYSSDIWALGMTLVELITGRCLWKKAAHDNHDYAAYFRATDKVEYLHRMLAISLPIAHLLHAIFDLDPEARPSIVEIRAAIMDVKIFTDLKAKWKPYIEAASSQPSQNKLDTPSSQTNPPSALAVPSVLLNNSSTPPADPSPNVMYMMAENKPFYPQASNKILKLLRNFRRRLRFVLPSHRCMPLRSK